MRSEQVKQRTHFSKSGIKQQKEGKRKENIFEGEIAYCEIKCVEYSNTLPSVDTFFCKKE